MNCFQNNNPFGGYLFATEAESADIRQNFPSFVEERTAFFAFGAGSGQGENIYRFRTGDGTYIYVGDDERQDIIDAGLNFVDEGIAFEGVI